MIFRKVGFDGLARGVWHHVTLGRPCMSDTAAPRSICLKPWQLHVAIYGASFASCSAFMIKIFGLTMTLLTCSLVALSWATERTDTFRVVDASDQVITFSDGTQLWKADPTYVESLKEGVKIKLAYEERAGRHVVTAIEAAE